MKSLSHGGRGIRSTMWRSQLIFLALTCVVSTISVSSPSQASQARVRPPPLQIAYDLCDKNVYIQLIQDVSSIQIQRISNGNQTGTPVDIRPSDIITLHGQGFSRLPRRILPAGYFARFSTLQNGVLVWADVPDWTIVDDRTMTIQAPYNLPGGSSSTISLMYENQRSCARVGRGINWVVPIVTLAAKRGGMRFVVVQAPSKVQSVSALGFSHNTINVSWQRSGNNVDYYHIFYRGKGTQQFFRWKDQIPGAHSSASITVPTPGTTYEIDVFAINAGGSSPTLEPNFAEATTLRRRPESAGDGYLAFEDFSPNAPLCDTPGSSAIGGPYDVRRIIAYYNNGVGYTVTGALSDPSGMAGPYPRFLYGTTQNTFDVRLGNRYLSSANIVVYAEIDPTPCAFPGSTRQYVTLHIYKSRGGIENIFMSGGDVDLNGRIMESSRQNVAMSSNTNVFLPTPQQDGFISGRVQRRLEFIDAQQTVHHATVLFEFWLVPLVANDPW